MDTIIDPIGFAERHWGIGLKRVGHQEYRSISGCPFCGDSGKGSESDRFRIFLDGSPRFWCRVCGKQGFIDALVREKLTPEELRLRRIEAEQRRLTREHEEHEHRLSALEKMAQCTDHLRYHQQLDDEALAHWWGQGMTGETIEKYLLGFCPRCPTDREGRPSYTIPVINRGKLENIRHRLRGAMGGDKYRPHVAGLGVSLFNVDRLDKATDRIIVSEGEVKSIVLTQSGFPAVGICGKRSFKREWLDWFAHVPLVYVALDPDATESAERLAAMFGNRGRVVETPCKVDDMIVRHKAGQADIERFLDLARPTRVA